MQKKHKITRKTTNMAMSSTDEGPHANDLFSRTNETPQRLTAKPLTPVVRIYLKIYLSKLSLLLSKYFAQYEYDHGHCAYFLFVPRRFVGKIFSLGEEAYQATNNTLHIKHPQNQLLTTIFFFLSSQIEINMWSHYRQEFF